MPDLTRTRTPRSREAGHFPSGPTSPGLRAPAADTDPLPSVSAAHNLAPTPTGQRTARPGSGLTGRAPETRREEPVSITKAPDAPVHYTELGLRKSIWSITLTGREYERLPPITVRLEAAAFIWYDYLTPAEARTVARALLDAADMAENAA